jgi:phytoene dehydrogenase-like protein
MRSGAGLSAFTPLPRDFFAIRDTASPSPFIRSSRRQSLSRSGRLPNDTYLERKEGIWYSIGGMSSLVRACRAFTGLCGKIRVQTEAREIVVKMDDGAVRIDGEELPADVVVSNADFVHTYRDLIRPEARENGMFAGCNACIIR